MKEKLDRDIVSLAFWHVSKDVKKKSMEEISLRDALTSSNWSVKRSMSVNIYNDAEGFLFFKKTNGRSFLGRSYL